MRSRWHSASWSSLIVVAAAGALPAQTRDDGALWLAWVAQGRFGAPGTALGDWRWWFDGAYRQRGEGEHLELAMPRVAVGYALHERLLLHAGYALVVNEPVGRDEFLEHRPWQQLLWNAPIGDLTVQFRSRFEQRLVETDGDTGLRFRELIRTTLPLAAESPLYVALADELFVDLDDTDWGQRAGLRQNRAFVGLGCFLDDSRHAAIEIGYLNQWLDRPGADRMNHALAITLFTTF